MGMESFAQGTCGDQATGGGEEGRRGKEEIRGACPRRVSAEAKEVGRERFVGGVCANQLVVHGGARRAEAARVFVGADAQAQGGCRGANLALEQTASRRLRGVLHLPVLPFVQRGADRNASRRPAGTGEEGMGEGPVPVQAPRAVAVTGCGEGANVV